MTLIEMLQRNATQYPDKTAIIQETRKITYRELLCQSSKLANALIGAGLKKGDRVGVLLPKTPEVILSFLGIAMAGCIFVPIDHTQLKTSVQYVFNLTSPSALIVDAKLYPILSCTMLPCAKERIVLVGEQASLPCFSWEQIMSQSIRVTCEPKAVQDDDVAYLNFTSGTTGMPKGAITTHANIFWNTLAAVQSLGLTHDDVHLCMFPVSLHPHELFARSLYLGGTAVLVDTIYPKTIAKTVADHKITCMMAVSAIYDALTRQHQISPLDLRSLRIPESGGSFTSFALVKKFENQFGTPIFPVWGSTEATGIALATPIDAAHKPESMGKPCRHYEVKIVDDDGTEAPPGVIGEMRIRGPAVCSAYYNNSVETNRHMQDGWFFSGDLAMADHEGFYYFVDRKSRMMKVAGMKVFPSEIERVILGHPKIQEVAVTKMLDRVHGEMPKAFVVVKDGETIDREEIRRHCEGKIVNYKIPRVIKQLELLPKTPGGKIMYSKLDMLDQ